MNVSYAPFYYQRLTSGVNYPVGYNYSPGVESRGAKAIVFTIYSAAGGLIDNGQGGTTNLPVISYMDDFGIWRDDPAILSGLKVVAPAAAATDINLASYKTAAFSIVPIISTAAENSGIRIPWRMIRLKFAVKTTSIVGGSISALVVKE